MQIAQSILSFFIINKNSGEIRAFSNSKTNNFIQDKEILKKFLANFIKNEHCGTTNFYNFKTIYFSRTIIQGLFNNGSNIVFVCVFNKGVNSYQRNLFLLHIFFAFKNIYLKLLERLENNENLFSLIFSEILLGPLINNFNNIYNLITKKIDLVLFDNSEYITSMFIDLETKEIIGDIGSLLQKDYKVSFLQFKNNKYLINELVFQGLNLKRNYLNSYDKNIDYIFNNIKLELRATFPKTLFLIKFIPIFQGAIIVHAFNLYRMAKVRRGDPKNPSKITYDGYREIDFAYFDLLGQINENNQLYLIEKFFFEYFLCLGSNYKEIDNKKSIANSKMMKYKNMDYNLIYLNKEILKIIKGITFEYYKDEKDLIYKLKRKLKEENEKNINNQFIEETLSTRTGKFQLGSSNNNKDYFNNICNINEKNPLELSYNNFIKEFNNTELNHKLKSNDALGLSNINLYFSNDYSNINEFSELNLTKDNLNMIKRNVNDKSYCDFNIYNNLIKNNNKNNCIDIKSNKSEAEDKDDNFNIEEPFKSNATNIGYKADLSQDESIFQSIISLKK